MWSPSKPKNSRLEAENKALTHAIHRHMLDYWLTPGVLQEDSEEAAAAAAAAATAVAAASGSADKQDDSAITRGGVAALLKPCPRDVVPEKVMDSHPPELISLASKLRLYTLQELLSPSTPTPASTATSAATEAGIADANWFPSAADLVLALELLSDWSGVHGYEATCQAVGKELVLVAMRNAVKSENADFSAAGATLCQLHDDEEHLLDQVTFDKLSLIMRVISKVADLEMRRRIVQKSLEREPAPVTALLPAREWVLGLRKAQAQTNPPLYQTIRDRLDLARSLKVRSTGRDEHTGLASGSAPVVTPPPVSSATPIIIDGVTLPLDARIRALDVHYFEKRLQNKPQPANSLRSVAVEGDPPRKRAR